LMSFVTVVEERWVANDRQFSKCSFKPSTPKLATNRTTSSKLACVHFYTPVFRRDVLWYSVVRLSVCLSRTLWYFKNGLVMNRWRPLLILRSRLLEYQYFDNPFLDGHQVLYTGTSK
jgi:hypothetical protein